LISPADGAQLTDSLVLIQASAADDSAVSRVEFIVDGSVPPGGTDTTAPYEYLWDTSGLADSSSHWLAARAWDEAGNWSLSDTVHVLVVKPHPPATEPTRVVVLVIDGARYTETFGDANHTYVKFMWNQLRPQGTLFTNFRNEGQTSTNPGHASIATGTWQYIANDGSERPSMPTFFEYYRHDLARPQTQCYMIAGKSKLDVIAYSTHGDYGAVYGATADVGLGSDEATFQAAVSDMSSHHPRLVFINFADVDRAGHSGNWNNYVSAIATADSLAYELWNFLQSDSFYAGKTVFMITNDHGRHDDAHGGFTSHGDGCEGCRHIMLLALGSGIKQNYTVSTTRTQIDICPTVASIMGFQAAYAAGSVMSEMFASPVTSSFPAPRGEPPILAR